MTEEVVTEDGETSAPQYTEVEQAAIERGWKPKEEYSGEPERWRSAEVFMALDEPLKRIEHQSKELKALRNAIEASKEHYTKVESAAFDRALKSLQNERKQAILDGDSVKAFELEEKVDEVRADRQRLIDESRQPAVQETPTLVPEFVEWQSRNSWYNSDKAMTAVADAYGKELHAQGYTPVQVLRQVTEKVKEDFPHKFKPAAGRSQAVESSTRSGIRASTSDDMTETERDIMRKIVKSGVMTEQQYKADLKKIKEL